MKHYKKYILIILIAFSLGACKKDFLEVVDKTVLLKQGYVIDIETTNHYLNGVYNNLATYVVEGTYLPYPEVAADNMKTVRNIFLAAYNWDFSPNAKNGGGDPVKIWQSYYGIIRDCNFVIEKAEEYKTQNETKANLIKGQAFAIRAMVHFVLCNIFAQAYNFTTDASHLGIPYITSSDIEVPVSRQTVKQVYDMIIDDLSTAMLLLPNTVIFTRELMNYQAAKALLARVYLFKEDYVAAKNLSRQVMADIPIMGVADYPSKLYTTQDNEALFRMPPGDGSKGYYVLLMGYYSSSLGSLSYVPTNDIIQLLRENLADKRSNWVKDTSNAWQIRKFPKSVTGQAFKPDGDHYQVLIRSSELCLIAAEAYAKLNIMDSAQIYINAIRQRANITLPNLTATGSALLDTIYKERRKEMCFDGLRMWDLKRWKMGVSRIDAANPAIQILPYPSNKAVAAIPKNDVELSGLVQNPGY